MGSHQKYIKYYLVMSFMFFMSTSLGATKISGYECKLTGEFMAEQANRENKFEFEVHKKKSRKHPRKIKFINDITLRNYSQCNELVGRNDKLDLLLGYKTPEHQQFELLENLRKGENIQCKNGKNMKVWSLKPKFKGQSVYVYCHEGEGCKVEYQMTCKKVY